MKEKSKLNAGWHKLHPMPEHATIDQRIEWHVQHLRHCQCRTELPEKLKEEMTRRGILVSAEILADPMFSDIEVY